MAAVACARRVEGSPRPPRIDQIQRTVQRAPEAVVKVLPRDCNDLKAVSKHVDYIGRYAKLELESDDGERLQGRIANAVLDDWGLDIDDVRRQSKLACKQASV